ncbi:MAG TPA: tRNA (adenosine(37)-N6)-threonylcarbamoyltransferase complex ATPase subunit type 1 TsaE [Rhodospirillaceae bacterium]|nr:tRNA (adenosine(37)-N6)-threonylcarbamoyltransferase complex ATPase subunit type 1 TsaE [Rhodospirillaceae bacterium]
MTPNMQTKTHEYLHENDLPELAREYAGLWLKPGTVVALHGDLGTGKTALVRAFIRMILDAPDMAVPSPTFTLLQQYDLPDLVIYHYDLYRMTNADELIELNWAQATAEGLVFVEWPERAGKLLPPHFAVHISDANAVDFRNITVAFQC